MRDSRPNGSTSRMRNGFKTLTCEYYEDEELSWSYTQHDQLTYALSLVQLEVWGPPTLLDLRKAPCSFGSSPSPCSSLGALLLAASISSVSLPITNSIS